MQKIKTVSSRYNDVTIWQTKDGYDFEVAGGTHATWSRSRILTGYIWDALTAAALLHPGDASKRILVLGFGGGTVVRQICHFLPEAKVTAVEIDPMMIDLAHTYMAAAMLHAKILLGDGYVYASHAAPVFDVIIDDIFVGLQTGVTRPSPLRAEDIQQTCKCLKKDGIYIANMITGQTTQTAVQATKRAFRETFAVCNQIRPAKGFNAGLIGGETRPSPTLKGYAQLVAHPYDLRDWSNIRVRSF